MFTAVVIFLSKYFSKAKENKNNEKTEIKIEGIKVNKEKNAIYFLLALEPVTFISFLSEFLTSIKIKMNTRAYGLITVRTNSTRLKSKCLLTSNENFYKKFFCGASYNIISNHLFSR